METGAASVQTEADLLEPLSPEPSHPTVPPQQGKLRKTAFKFFSSRRSICVLPSFFGGLGKGPGRGSSSKTGVTKSRTHDGVSRGCWDETLQGSGDVIAGDFEFRTHREINNGGGGDGESPKGSEGIKSQLLPWQRRGLRGLFSSIRRHRRSKTNAEVERSISCLEMSPTTCNVPAITQLPSGYSSSAHLGGPSTEPIVPDSAAGIKDALSEPVAAVAECVSAEVPLPESASGGKDGSSKTETGGKDKRGEAEDEISTACESLIVPSCAGKNQQEVRADSGTMRLAEQDQEGAESDPPAASSSEHASLVFGDVSSLKSFDSLTGCGDIIADQDDDSVAESSISGERGSRGGGKRGSCLVTYQGGGEEMATPDEADTDYLEGLWEAKTANEVCYVPAGQQIGGLPITPDQPISSLHTISKPTTTSSCSSSSGATISSCSNSSPLAVLETVLGPTDLTTPQSDHQESVPNSDEGYYDSTTPGAEEDAATAAREQARPERLPRDSYSGDALYELFEPDDRLLSPSVPDDDAFLGDGLASPIYSLKTGAMDTCAMETEEDRLSKIQQALFCCDLQGLGQSPANDTLQFNRAPFFSESAPSSGTAGKKKGGELQSPTTTLGAPVPHHKPEGSPSADIAKGHYKQGSSCSYSQIPSPLLQERGPLPCGQGTGMSLSDSQSQEELTTVCFSQALVDFTKHTHHIFCNSTESLDGSETGSPFGQNLQALPAIVTFDVVDMENEGEFEQQTELAEGEEELASPFEPFDDESCYLRKDAFAECDERIFDAYEQSLLLGNAWGITSLPRHLNSSRACQSSPMPLGPNRRSRSLDTDSLDTRICEASNTVRANQEPVARAGSLQRRAKKPPQPASDASIGEHRNGSKQEASPSQDPVVQITNSVPFCQRQMSGCTSSLEMCTSAKLASTPGLTKISRPSDLALLAGPAPSAWGHNPGQCSGTGTILGGNGKFVAAGQYSGDNPQLFYHSSGYAELCHSQGKARPVAVTQGVSQLSCNPSVSAGPGGLVHSNSDALGGKPWS